MKMLTAVPPMLKKLPSIADGTIFLLKRGARDLKKQNMHGAASLKKKKTEFPTDMHAQCKLSGEKGKFCFLRAFSKNVLKRQIIIFHLASGNKMSKKLL